MSARSHARSRTRVFVIAIATPGYEPVIISRTAVAASDELFASAQQLPDGQLPQLVPPLRAWKQTTTRLPVENWRTGKPRCSSHRDFSARQRKAYSANSTAIFLRRYIGAITAIIEQMTRAMLTGSNYTTAPPLTVGTLQERERRIAERVEFFRKTAAAEGGVTGAGGIFLGLADFPLLLTLKLKLLFEIAALYGYSGDDYTERLYLLYIFQLAFSNAAHRQDVYAKMPNWREQPKPASIDEFDWRVVPAAIPRLHRPREARPTDSDHRRSRRRRRELSTGAQARRHRDQCVSDAVV